VGFLDRFQTARRIQRLKAPDLDDETAASLKRRLVATGPSVIRPLLDVLGHGGARGPALEVLADLLRDDTLPAYIGALGSPNPAVVSGISRILGSGRRYDPSALLSALENGVAPRTALEPVLDAQKERISPKVLIERVPEVSRSTRAAFLRLLHDIADDSIVADMTRLLSDEDWWLRVSMCRMLGALGVSDSFTEIAALVSDPSRDVRLEAVRTLHKLRVREALPKLVAALRDGDLKVQTEAIDAVSALGDADTVPLLLEVLKDESEYVRRAAVEVLNAVATTEAVQDLVRALQDADWWVRVRAADALGALGGERVVDAVVGLLREEDEFIRRYAVEILNTVPSKKAVPPLIEALKDEDWWVRERAIDALGRTRDLRAVAPLMDLIDDDRVAALCARALAEIGDVRAAEVLEPRIDHANEEIRRACSGALDELRGGPGAPARGTRPAPEPHTRSVFEADPGARGRVPTGIPASVSPKTNNEPAAPAPRSENRPLNFHMLPPDIVLLDRYRVIRRVGRGGFGAVYLVDDAAIDEQIILKILNPSLSADPNAVRRFVRELKLTRKITHRNVIRIHDFLDLGGIHAVSMEYFPGMDLGKIIKTAGRLDPGPAVSVALQICRGLEAAHAVGVIHRDMKPANVLLDSESAVKIVDFGLASGLQVGSRLTQSGLLIGTPEYMAPEQINGGKVDARSDIYSVGILLYEMLGGKQPYTGDTPVSVLFQHLEGSAPALSTLVDGLIPELEAVVGAAMARDPEARPATAGALHALLEPLEPALHPEDDANHGQNRRVS
jgi:serine/threonine-protein kinase